MLKHLLPLVLLALPAAAADSPTVLDAWAEDPAQIFEAGDIALSDLQWTARPIVVFANSPRDPAFVDQMAEIERGLSDLAERDVILITDTDPESDSALRRQLRPRGFMLVLIGKDGQVKLRKPLPWTVRELSRSIDKMPMRQREMRERD